MWSQQIPGREHSAPTADYIVCSLVLVFSLRLTFLVQICKQLTRAALLVALVLAGRCLPSPGGLSIFQPLIPLIQPPILPLTISFSSYSDEVLAFAVQMIRQSRIFNLLQSNWMCVQAIWPGTLQATLCWGLSKG